GASQDSSPGHAPSYSCLRSGYSDRRRLFSLPGINNHWVARRRRGLCWLNPIGTGSGWEPQCGSRAESGGGKPKSDLFFFLGEVPAMNRWLLLVATPIGLSVLLGTPGHAPSQEKIGIDKLKATDAYGDPLPKGVVARLGTLRWRNPEGTLAFSPDG